jgi:site-specific DNA recombinase
MKKEKQSVIKKTGIIYCRVSSKEQVNGTSLGSQERICRDYAIKNNIKILKIYIESGESAKTIKRTEFNKAISFCSDKNNSVNFFMVYKVDRFSRSNIDHVTVRALLKKVGTQLCSVTEYFDDSPMGKFTEGILSLSAEFDNNIRTERSTKGMLERLKQGVWVWPAPFGYYRPYKGSNIVPDPKVAPYIKLCFEEYSKGMYTLKQERPENKEREENQSSVCRKDFKKYHSLWIY